MNILAIETSCDETGVAVVEATGNLDNLSFTVKANSLYSQVALHKEYGGVFPNLARREHAKNLPTLLKQALTQADMWELTDRQNVDETIWEKARNLLAKEPGLFEELRETIGDLKRPSVDHIAVTYGPGLEPALWVGLSFAQALSVIWNIPLVPTNHMEGHITSVLVNSGKGTVNFPALALLISGGHTELVSMTNWTEHSVIGQTRDDAVGEAFDKVARMLDLPYPGGPEVSKLASYAREHNIPKHITLPRPMIHSKDYDFSFSGLKTAVLYTIRDIPELTNDTKADICREFENAVADVLVLKTKNALEETGAQTLIIAGGVVANNHIRTVFEKVIQQEFPSVHMRIPTKELATDNALMIASAGYVRILNNTVPDTKEIRARGNLSLSTH
jgi:N6-L-threonylcarbamoyladenine synthase